MNINLETKLKNLPDLPGCYLMKNISGEIIYVGKAKNLKNRVKSYFNKVHNLKTTKLVSEIVDLDYIITSSDKEAFVLEINLIKENKPKYNILLKDDKTYPYIVITKEKHPRLIITRKKRNKDFGYFYGPFPSVSSARETLDLLNKIYPLRKCYKLPKKECLYYHLKQCLAPCIKNDNIDYKPIIDDIKSFLNGNTKQVIKNLEEKMYYFSNELKFEQANEYKKLIESINKTVDKQKIVLKDMSNSLFVGTYFENDMLSIHLLYLRQGEVILSTFEIIPVFSSLIDTLENYILLNEDSYISVDEMYFDQEVDIQILEELLSKKIYLPKKGEKKELLNLASLNAKKDFKENIIIKEQKVLKELSTLKELEDMLNIKSARYIEAFDNSNLFGEFPISAMVVYINGKPEKNMFRKYHVKTVVGQNDYETMKEVVYRRYTRLIDEQKELPTLIMMDGGKIQVNACLEVLEKLNLNIDVCGLKKDDKHKLEAIYYNNIEYKLDKRSNIYLFLLNISEKVHSFAISFFRQSKTKSFLMSLLDDVKGLGKKRKEELLKKYVSISNIKSKSISELQEVLPKDVAINLYNKLNGDNND